MKKLISSSSTSSSSPLHQSQPCYSNLLHLSVESSTTSMNAKLTKLARTSSCGASTTKRLVKPKPSLPTSRLTSSRLSTRSTQLSPSFQNSPVRTAKKCTIRPTPSASQLVRLSTTSTGTSDLMNKYIPKIINQLMSDVPL